MKPVRNHRAHRYRGGRIDIVHQNLIIEEPLSIRIDGRPYAVVMRTPGEEIAHVAGFCLAEGLVDSPDDFAAIGYCSEADVNVVTATMTPQRRRKIGGLLRRRGFVSQTSCGICGKELIDDLHQIVQPMTLTSSLAIDRVETAVGLLNRHQALYRRTGGSHAAMVLDPELELMSHAEDVGRHNALDKAVGNVFMAGRLQRAAVIVLSSRISYELVQKAARAHVEIVIALSRPTQLAVDLGRRLNMSLASLGKRGDLLIYSGKKRFSGSVA